MRTSEHATNSRASFAQAAGGGELSESAALYGIWKTRVFYPAVQVVKAALRRGSQPAGSGLRLRPAQFTRLLTNSGLEPSSVIPASFLAIPSPLDEWFPASSERVARRLEGRPAARRRFATQIVFSARKSERPGS